MLIGIVGGLERDEARYLRLAARAGHSVECHAGHLAGRGAETLASLVQRAELVVIVTDLNSHGAVQLARRLVRERERRMLLVRRCSVSRFATLLEALTIEERRSAVG
jgi:Uncharacterized protein conserved in bacteria (DUF2325)